MFNSKKRVKDVVGPLVLPGAGGESAQGQGGLSGSNIEKLEIAKRLAVRINVKKNLGAEAQVCRFNVLVRFPLIKFHERTKTA